MRAIAIAAGLGVFWAPQAMAACDLSLETRAPTLAAYTQAGEACLENLPGDYRIDKAMETRFAGLINAARTEHGLPPLILRVELANAARWHSLDMAANNFFSHASGDGRSAAQRITAFDRTLLSSVQRENIAAIQGPFDPETVIERLHKGLMESESHRKSILAEDVTHLALGVISRPKGVWVTQIFVKKDGAFDQPVPLRLVAGSQAQQTAKLTGWEPGSLTLIQKGRKQDLGGGAKLNARLPEAARGTYTLTVRGEKPGPSPNSCIRIHFTGPRVEIIAPTSS